MKKIISLFLILSFCNLFAQQVLLEGFVERSKTDDLIFITVNDTLNKIGFNQEELFKKIWNDKNLVLHLEKSGEFKMVVNESDDLHFYSYQCEPKKFKVSDLIKRDSIHIVIEPEPCEILIPCKEKNTDLYIFIGKKIKVESAPYVNYCNFYPMDLKSVSQYQIIENLYNKFPNEIIEFYSYNHFSSVTFDEYDYAILYVGKFCNELIQLKYQYDPVYRTKDGKWASPVTEDYNLEIKKSEKMGHMVKMKEPIRVPDSYSNLNLSETYLPPLYKIKKGKVFLQYGYTPQEIVEIREKKFREYK